MKRRPDRFQPHVRRAVAAAAGLLLAGLLGLLLLGAGAPAVDAVPHRSSAADLFDRMGGGWPGTPSAADGPCAAFAYEIRVGGRVVTCSHGPDPIPDAVRAAGRVSLDDLRARGGGTDGTDGTDGSGGTDGTAAPLGGGDVPCVGDGTSGLRVVAVYAYPAGTASRFAEVAPLIRSWAGEVDAVFDASAAQTGGSRHVRWLHDADCVLSLREVELSEAGVYGGSSDPMTAMVNELVAAGFDRYDRRYLVWVDASSFDTGICGVAINTWDESPGPENTHNGVPAAGIGLMGRVDRDCWGRAAPDNLVEAHELMHTLGAVQPSAPYSSSLVTGSSANFFGHCIDEYDTMCYADGTPKELIYPCPLSGERLFDCRHDTYFSTQPPAGSYLATHWNTAMNAFLVRNDPVAGFIDVGVAFRDDIAWLAESGITAGCSPDGERYCPDATVTRGQMASFLARALDLPPSATDFFTDDGASVYQPDINRVAAAGITRGCTPTRYCPDAPVTRGQMAAFLDRALDLPPTTADYFSDDASSPFAAAINRVAAAGITAGCTPTRYCPDAPVTRGQMAAFLHRALVD